MIEDIIIYVNHINYIGGIETWLYEIAKKYGEKRNITLLYGWIAPEQLYRVKKIIKCVKYEKQEIECNKFIFCFGFEAINTVKAKEFIYFIHADYKAQNIKATIPKETTSIYAVSKLAKDSFIEMHKEQLDKLGLKVETAYNPITIEKPKRVLTLISPTRLTKEKGGPRMIAMAKRLKEKGIPFNWFVYSTTDLTSETSHFIMMKPELDIRDYIADADYLIQLSDTESYAYSIVEAACLGTPIVASKMPVLDEMNIKEGENAFILEFDLSNLDEVIDKMYKNNLKGFTYKKKESNDEYLKILGKETKNKYKCPIDKLVKAKLNYKDLVENKDMVENEEFIATVERAEYLQRIGYVEILN